MLMKIVVVTEFEPKNYFQWLMVLQKYSSELGIIVTSIVASPVYKRVHNNFQTDPYWNPLKEADAIFVYPTKMMRTARDINADEWWTLPRFVKQFMRSDAKMIVQYDDEFVWLFHPNITWWNTKENPDNHGGAEQFFKDTGILEIPDAHLTVMVDDCPFKGYTTKPIRFLLLPQLVRHNPTKYSTKHKTKNIVIVIHTPISSSIEKTLENVVRPKNYPITLFLNNTYQNQYQYRNGPEFCERFKLPRGSRAYVRLSREPYMEFLNECSIGLDDCEGYIGWSRFAMECAIAYVPCVGSTPAIKELFPELYTAPQDYAKQIEVIDRLLTDNDFHQKVATYAHTRVLELLDSKKLAEQLITLFKELGAPLTGKPEPQRKLEPDPQAQPHP